MVVRVRLSGVDTLGLLHLGRGRGREGWCYGRSGECDGGLPGIRWWRGPQRGMRRCVT